MTVTERQRLSPQRVIDQRIRALQHGYQNNRAESVAALARLRRAVGKPPGTVLDILEHTVADEFTHGWHRDEPSYAEIAAHHAMTLYAVHQQSRMEGMHQAGRRLGHAVRALHHGDAIKPSDPIPSRFAMLGTSDDLSEVVHHLRGLVQLLRAAGRPLDYALLASQLITWQQRGPDDIRRVWGRDFHLPPTPAPASNNDPV